MPARTLKPCKHRGCAALVADGQTHCAKHASEAQQTNWKPDRVRGNRHQRGYGTAWEKLRAAVLRRDNYLCQPCLRVGRVTQASAVDHIVAKARGGTDEPTNLQAICRACHAAKTARERLAG